MKKFLIIFISVFLFTTGIYSVKDKAYAYGECDQYGFMATYDILTDSCKCMSGYVFGKDIMGNATCVSGSGVCSDKYGYNSKYDSISNSCECSYGYTFGKDSIGRTKCVSYDSICTDKLGYSSRYNSLEDICECSYGYLISEGKCVHGETYCSSKHGLYSSYDSTSNICECDDGYTFDDDNECVKKQNNVYFLLKELDTDSKLAIIKSDYDYKYYLVSYGTGCYATSFRRYLNKQIVVNLGTDFHVDRWDRIVLQNNNEVCDIRSVEKVDSLFTLEEEEDIEYYYVPPPTPVTTIVTPYQISTPEPVEEVVETKVEATTTLEEERIPTEVNAESKSNKSIVSRVADFIKKLFKF